MSWYEKSVIYQIYPIGFCGAPRENDGKTVSRIGKIKEWIPHIKNLHADTVLLNPVFESDRHGYDTRDYRKLDCRLGTNEDFAEVCAALHENGLRVMLDGVFNHVGRGFWAFQDVLRNREHSAYCGWFHLNFGGDTCYNDGLWYETWEGHYELVKLNLGNPDVRKYLFDSVRFWAERFGIDGLRLDVAYCLDETFQRELRSFCDRLKPDFFLFGEILSGDYNRIVNPQMLESCTNYEARKGLYSSFNDLNLFEIAHTLNREFGRDNQYAVYKGKKLLSFADNHDVTRLASILREKRHLPLVYGLMFVMPGIPCVYYGSEWGAQGDKQNRSDDDLRPFFAEPEQNDLCDVMAALSEIHRTEPALYNGSYRHLVLTNRQLVLERADGDCRIVAAINADGADFAVRSGELPHAARELFSCSSETAPEGTEGIKIFDGGSSAKTADLSQGVTLPPYSLTIWKE